MASPPRFPVPSEPAGDLELASFTPAQRTYLAALAACGMPKKALAAAGASRAQLRAWMADPAFRQAAEDAEADFTDTLLERGFSALAEASPEQLLAHPNLFFFHIKARDWRFRDAVKLEVNNDQRSQTINVLDRESAEELAKVYLALRRQQRAVELGQAEPPDGSDGQHVG